VYILDIENKTGTKLPLKNSQEKETFLENFIRYNFYWKVKI
jgi:hypothetical protein